MQGEGALHADTERLLADGERLADARALPLDHDALVHLHTPALALDHLEVHAHGVSGLEARNLAQLGALDGIDDVAHKEEARRAEGPG